MLIMLDMLVPPCNERERERARARDSLLILHDKDDKL